MIDVTVFVLALAVWLAWVFRPRRRRRRSRWSLLEHMRQPPS